jgi:hypothetical protein
MALSKQHDRPIDQVWDLQRLKQPRFDPLHSLPAEVVHQIFVHVTSWLESIRPGFTKFHQSEADGPLFLASVSRRWSEFVVADPLLWSQILVDTDEEEATDHLRLFLHCSRATRLDVVLQGVGAASDTLLKLLAPHTHRINSLVTPYGKPLIAIEGLKPYLTIDPWHEIELGDELRNRRGKSSSGSAHYVYPTSIRSLWVAGRCLPSTLSALPRFEMLSLLSIESYHSQSSDPSFPSEIVLPNVQVLIIHVKFWPGGPWNLLQFFVCPYLRVLNFDSTFTLSDTALRTYRTFLNDLSRFPHLVELQVGLMIYPNRKDALYGRDEKLLRELLKPVPFRRIIAGLRHVALTVSHPSNNAQYPRTCESLEDVFIEHVPLLNELTTSRFRPVGVLPLRTLRLYHFTMEPQSTTVEFPHLENLEIEAKRHKYLSVLERIKAPKLLRLHVQIEHAHLQSEPQQMTLDCRALTSALMHRVSLQVKSNTPLPTFLLPPTQSLVVGGQMELRLLDPIPFSYVLNCNMLLSSDRLQLLKALKVDHVTEWIYNGRQFTASLTKFTLLHKITFNNDKYHLSEPSPSDQLIEILAENTQLCPKLTSLMFYLYPSHWQTFVLRLYIRNHAALLNKSAQCITELAFSGPLHSIIADWLHQALHGKLPDMREKPPARDGSAWPVRPSPPQVRQDDTQKYRACYVCHVAGFEPGCQEFETRKKKCMRKRGNGATVLVV